MNILNDIIPARYRQIVYALITLLALVWSVYEVSDGDWKKFVGGLIVALTTATAASNTPTNSGPVHRDEDADDDTSGTTEYTPEPPYVEPEPSLLHGDGADRGASLTQDRNIAGDLADKDAVFRVRPTVSGNDTDADGPGYR